MAFISKEFQNADKSSVKHRGVYINTMNLDTQTALIDIKIKKIKAMVKERRKYTDIIEKEFENSIKQAEKLGIRNSEEFESMLDDKIKNLNIT